MTSLNAHANTTTPAAGATLATITVAPGVYEVSCAVYFTGTVTAATEQDNVAVQSDPVTASTFVTAAVLDVPGVASASPVSQRVDVMAQTTILAIAVAAGTSGAVYHVSLTADAVTVGQAEGV